MKKHVLALAAFTCGVLSAGVIRIMPLGDSITYGANTAGGYRLPLYNLLTQANYGVDFVGSETGNGASDLPDWDHEGHSGWWLSHNDGGIYQNVGKWLAHVETPDVVLVHIGTNDGGYATVDKLRALILRIHNLVPKTHIVATTLLGRPTNNTGIDEHIRNNFNPGVQPMVESLAQQGVPVHFLDMYSVLDYPRIEVVPDVLVDAGVVGRTPQKRCGDDVGLRRGWLNVHVRCRVHSARTCRVRHSGVGDARLYGRLFVRRHVFDEPEYAGRMRQPLFYGPQQGHPRAL